jgi:glycosyltransferase involved in cell wall biosynthesis
MKVVGIINHNNPGGAQKALSKLRDAMLSEYNCDFKIVYLYGDLNSNQDGVVLVDECWKILKYPLALYRLVRFLRAEKVDALIGFLPLSNICSSVIGEILGIKHRVVSHRNPVSTYGRIVRALDYILGCTFLYRSIVCNSAAVMGSVSSYPSRYKDKCRVVYNGVESILETACDDFIECWRRESKEHFNIVSVGRLSDQKNYTLALDIAGALPSTYLHIAGHGELEEELMKYASENNISNVKFYGRLSRSQIDYMLENCDLYLQTSRYEGQSNSLLEALHAGSCIVSSDIPPQREVLEISDGVVVGTLISLEQPLDSWVEAIEKLVLDKDLRLLYRIAAKKRADDFSIRAMAQGFYEELR